MRLIEEIKNRAKGCITSKNYPEAVALYSKAIEVCPAPDTAAKAILYANRSMCNLSMSKAVEAVEDAKHAVTLDPSYLKGWYRLGSAYQQQSLHALALQAYEEGLKRKPDDKELLTQVH
ncbi:hypothetical protein EON65_55040 [archaeon]|nr:MAG: hypothetical protein EON65_55040 [archaeon]